MACFWLCSGSRLRCSWGWTVVLSVHYTFAVVINKPFLVFLLCIKILYNSWGVEHSYTATIRLFAIAKVTIQIHHLVRLLANCGLILLINSIEVKEIVLILLNPRCWSPVNILKWWLYWLLVSMLVVDVDSLWLASLFVKRPISFKYIKSKVSASCCNIPLVRKVFLPLLHYLFFQLIKVLLSTCPLDLFFTSLV